MTVSKFLDLSGSLFLHLQSGSNNWAPTGSPEVKGSVCRPCSAQQWACSMGPISVRCSYPMPLPASPRSAPSSGPGPLQTPPPICIFQLPFRRGGSALRAPTPPSCTEVGAAPKPESPAPPPTSCTSWVKASFFLELTFVQV